MVRESSLTARKIVHATKARFEGIYPEQCNRIPDELFIVGAYHSLLGLHSVKSSPSQALQLKLLKDFEEWKPHIQVSAPIPWLDSSYFIYELIVGESEDYSFGFGENIEPVRPNYKSLGVESGIDSIYFWTLNTLLYKPSTSNYQQQIERGLSVILTEFWPGHTKSDIPGDKELFELVFHDVTSVLFHQAEACNREGIDQEDTLAHLLHTLTDIHFPGTRPKKECYELASKLRELRSYGVEGREPRHIGDAIAFAFSEASGEKLFVTQVKLNIEQHLSPIKCTVCDNEEGLLIWQYPNYERQWKVSIRSKKLMAVTHPNGEVSHWVDDTKLANQLCLELEQ